VFSADCRLAADLGPSLYWSWDLPASAPGSAFGS